VRFAYLFTGLWNVLDKAGKVFCSVAERKTILAAATAHQIEAITEAPGHARSFLGGHERMEARYYLLINTGTLQRNTS